MSALVPLLRVLARGALSLPHLRERPRNDRGAELDAQLSRILTLGAGRATFDELGAERARLELRRQTQLGQMAPLPVHRVEDRTVPAPDADVPVRIFVPRAASERLPATVYYHGGGFVLGDLAAHDTVYRHLAVRSGSIVVGVGYRLAPEHPFPAAVDDAVAAFEWVHAHAGELGIDPSRIAVAGESAGGNLAAVVAQILRDRGGPMPCFQLLLYPAVDFTRSFESHRTFASGYLLTEATIDWFVASYLSDPAQERDPRASPLVTPELSGLPPAHVIVAGFDPLRDEGEAYAEALRGAGVPTTSRCYDTLTHGFLYMTGIVDAAAHAIDDMADVLRARLWP